MAGSGLPPPPDGFDRLAWRLVGILPDQLLRLGTRDRPGGGGRKLRFRRSAEYRFNAPAGQFGVLYAALDLATAFAETVLRDRPQLLRGGDRPIFEYREFDAREVQVLGAGGLPRSLRLVQLWDAGLAAAHVDNRIATLDDYALTRHWSLAFHGHPLCVDGIAYLSRFMGSGIAVVLFGCCDEAVDVAVRVPLFEHDGFPSLVTLFDLAINPPRRP